MLRRLIFMGGNSIPGMTAVIRIIDDNGKL
jgi:hypothetical protein